MANVIAQDRDRTKAAKAFAAKWKGRSYEKGDTASFWLDLCGNVLGMTDVTTNVRFEKRTNHQGFIDGIIPDAKTIIEQKSGGIDLDKKELRQGEWVTPFEQAWRYARGVRYSQMPRWIIVCNFETFRIHDLETDHPDKDFVEFTLEELPDQLRLFGFLADPEGARVQREEAVSLSAGALIGRVYDLLEKQYVGPDAAVNAHSLNVLCVRLVFCLFAEDAGLFGRDAFRNYLAGLPTRSVRAALKELFRYLDTKPEDRDPYAADELKAFPYVNGGLFRDDVDVPNFTDEIVTMLLHEISEGTNWSGISPTIFGGVFEGTLNAETRRAGGMHYTSPENIHKVIDPLFLDDLRAELDTIVNDPGLGERARRNRLEAFHDKIAGLEFFDPACGSGNFLTETYLSLRKLETAVLAQLQNGQGTLLFDGAGSPLKVSLSQFHGIEINDFAVAVATTSLWIAELQANATSEVVFATTIDSLPLRDAASVVCGNALLLNWESVLPAERCSYLIGNPPFVGARFQTAEQKAELLAVLGKGAKNAGEVDYVGGWFTKTARYMQELPIRAAFVATNSICQGEQVAALWKPIYDLGFHIDFAHDTFKWVTETTGGAAVFCVIVGFSKQGGQKRLFHHSSPIAKAALETPAQLNAYLKDAADVFVWDRPRPLSEVPRMGIGSQPIDDGNYIFTPEEKAEFLAKEPGAEKFFHRFYGSQEFIKGIERWVLWLGEATPAELMKLPLCRTRIEAVRDFRKKSKRAQTQRAALRPQHFGTEIIPKTSALLVPKVSSERRRYIPLGFVQSDSLCSDLVFVVPDATLYHFGVVHSRAHNAWMRVVAGRLKSDYRYSAGLVYNTFVWPTPTAAQEAAITTLARRVLEARKLYPDSTIAQMYDPQFDYLFSDLVLAHSELDKAVEEAYGLAPGLDEADVVAHLFELYAAATATERS